MSLLNMDDPESMGLLSLGLRLMSTPGKLGQALGKSGLGALDDVTAAQGRKQQEEFRKLQMQQTLQAMAQQQSEQQRKQAQQAQEDQFRQGLISPQMQASQAALSGGGGPTMANAATMPPVDKGAGLMFDAMKAGLMSPLDYVKAQQKDTAPIKLGAGEKLLSPGSYRELANNPKDAADDKDVALLQLIHGKNTPGYMAALAKLGDKRTTHQPPVNVSYGSPQAGINEKGDPVFFQPSKDGTTPPALIKGFKPAPQNRDTKLPAEIQRMNIAADTMDKMLGQYETLLKTHNPRDPTVQASPAARANFQSLMKNIQLQFKEVQALGALSGPDLALMEAAITDPFTIKGAYYGRDGLNAQIKQARNLIKLRREASAVSQGRPEAAKPSDTDPLGLRQ